MTPIKLTKIVALILFVATLAVSCTSVHKMQDKITAALSKKASYSLDSAGRNSTDSSSLKKQKSGTSSTEDSNYTRVTVVEDFDWGGHGTKDTPTLKTRRYSGPAWQQGKVSGNAVPVAGIEDHSHIPYLYKRTTVYEKGNKTATAVNWGASSDSTTLSKKGAAKVKVSGDSSINVQTAHTTKESWHFGVSTTLLLSLLFLLILFIAYSIWKRSPWVAGISKFFNQTK
jgi:hypothetical protein